MPLTHTDELEEFQIRSGTSRSTLTTITDCDHSTRCAAGDAPDQALVVHRPVVRGGDRRFGVHDRRMVGSGIVGAATTVAPPRRRPRAGGNPCANAPADVGPQP